MDFNSKSIFEFIKHNIMEFFLVLVSRITLYLSNLIGTFSLFRFHFWVLETVQAATVDSTWYSQMFSKVATN